MRDEFAPNCIGKKNAKISIEEGRGIKDVDDVIVATLDDLAYELIKAYKYQTPPGLLEWLGTTATNGVRRASRIILLSRATKHMSPSDLALNCESDSIRYLVLCWVGLQMNRKFSPLPSRVREKLMLPPDCG